MAWPGLDWTRPCWPVKVDEMNFSCRAGMNLSQFLVLLCIVFICTQQAFHLIDIVCIIQNCELNGKSLDLLSYITH